MQNSSVVVQTSTLNSKLTDVDIIAPEELGGKDSIEFLGGVLAVRVTAFDDVHWCYWLADESYRSESILKRFSGIESVRRMVRKSVYWEVGGLDAQNLKVAFNDVDFCLKLREAGYRNVWASNAALNHHESLSRGAEDTPEKRARFASELRYTLRRWPNALNRDPHYNPNLALEHEDFGFATPPRWDEVSR